MPRACILVIFGGNNPAYKELLSRTFWRAITAAWQRLFLFCRGAGELLKQNPRKQHVHPAIRFFRVFALVTTIAAAWYIIWHPAWLVLPAGVLLVLAIVENTLTPRIET